MNELFNKINIQSVNLISKTGTEYNLTNQLKVLNIFQSMAFGKFMTARLILIDGAIDIIQNYPIIGGEVVKITLNTDQEPTYQYYTFKIYKIDKDKDSQDPTKKAKFLNIYMYSEEEYNSYLKISKRFVGTGSSLIQTLLTSNLQTQKTLFSIPDIVNFDFISNFWSAEQCIDYICKYANNGTYYDYMFYENYDGFHFKPISYLISQSPKSEISFDFSRDSLGEVDNVQLFKFSTQFDDLLWLKRGVWGSTNYYVDPDDYGYTKQEKTVSDFGSAIIYSGLNKNYNELQSDYENFISVVYNENYNTNNIRLTHLNLLNRFNLTCKLYGDLSRNIGDVYTLLFPNLDNDESSVHKSFSGNWLVYEINSIIFPNGVIHQNISFVKNSMFNNNLLDNI